MKKLLFLLLTIISLSGNAQSVDGGLKTIVATTTASNKFAINEALPSNYDPKERWIIRFLNSVSGPTTFQRNGLAEKAIKKVGGTDLTTGDIVAGGTYMLSYNGTYFQIIGDGGSGGGGGGSTFPSDVTFVLPSGFTLGKYDNGDTAPWTGLTAVQALTDAAVGYINPVFTSFSITGQATTVEVGTTLSGSKTFTWGITVNSGVVSTLDLYNVTTSANLLAGTANDGTQAQTITTVQLNSSGANQAWRGVGHDTGSSPHDFNSSDFTVTSWFYNFYGAVASSVTNSATVRALPQSSFYTGSSSVTLNTGSTLIKFVVALPPGKSITSVIDLDALSADITSQYVAQSSINVLDAGATNRSYNIYEMVIGVPYSANHRHVVSYN